MSETPELKLSIYDCHAAMAALDRMVLDMTQRAGMERGNPAVREAHELARRFETEFRRLAAIERRKNGL